MGKHELKLRLRRVYARVLFHTGLHAVMNRMVKRRMTILFGHCVTDPEVNGFLPTDMKISGDRLERILSWFAKRYDMVTIGGGLEALREGGSKSLIALSMDDGYRDNRRSLLPILEKTGAKATVFLETRPLAQEGVNWSHKMFWLLDRGESIDLLARRFQELSTDADTKEALRRALEEGGDLVYRVKRVLKYDADPDDRERVMDELFRAKGGDEASLCASLYLTWDDARAMAEAGIELGGHTVSHHVLSTLDAERQATEVAACTEAIERETGVKPGVFAYPFGRAWDYDESSREAVRAAGYAAAVNTHAGVNREPGLELKRLPIDDDADLALLVAEACGGFDFLRRFGVDLSE